MDEGQRLLTPTIPLVNWYSIRFHNGVFFSGKADEGLRKLFAAFPDNVALSDVLVKVAALNALYATNIYAIFPVAQHIAGLQIDSRLQARDMTLVDDIANITIAGRWRYNYSFSSKYCAWHAPDYYAVYDGYVDRMLWLYQQEVHFYQAGFRHYELRNYPKFMSIILAFKNHFHLESATLKEIDCFLWLYGQGVEPTVEEMDNED